MHQTYKYKQIIKALNDIENLKEPSLTSTSLPAIPLYRNAEVYNFLNQSLRMYSKNLFFITPLNKNYSLWGESNSSLKDLGDVEDFFQNTTGSILFPHDKIPIKYSYFYNDKRIFISKKSVQNRGYAFYISSNPLSSTEDKLNTILNDFKDGIDFLLKNAREQEKDLLLYYIGILDYLKSHCITLYHTFTFYERYGDYRLLDKAYQKNRRLLNSYARQFTLLYYKAILGIEFENELRLDVILKNIKIIITELKNFNINVNSIKSPELENPILMLESGIIICKKYPQIDTIFGIPSGGTEFSFLVAFLYERFKYKKNITVLSLPISQYTKDKVIQTKTIKTKLSKYLKTYTKFIKDKNILVLDDNSNTGATAAIATSNLKNIHPSSINFKVAEVDIYRTIVKNTDPLLESNTISNPDIFNCSVNIVPITYGDPYLLDFKQYRKLYKLKVIRSYYQNLLSLSTAHKYKLQKEQLINRQVKICSVHNEHDLYSSTSCGIQWIGVHLTYNQGKYILKVLKNKEFYSFITTYIENEFKRTGKLPIPWAEYKSIKEMLKNSKSQGNLNIVFLVTTNNFLDIIKCLKLLLPSTYEYKVHLQLQSEYNTSIIRKLKKTLRQNNLEGIELIQTVNMNNINAENEILCINKDANINILLLDSAQQGGTGKLTSLIKVTKFSKLCNKDFFIAGGLTPNNIENILLEFSKKNIEPFGFDIESGVETAHVQIHRTITNEYLKIRKDYKKINIFCSIINKSALMIKNS